MHNAQQENGLIGTVFHLWHRLTTPWLHRCLEAKRRHVELWWWSFDLFEDLLQAFATSDVQLLHRLSLGSVIWNWRCAARWKCAWHIHDDRTNIDAMDVTSRRCTSSVGADVPSSLRLEHRRTTPMVTAWPCWAVGRSGPLGLMAVHTFFTRQR